jgi:hypothetical protein
MPWPSNVPALTLPIPTPAATWRNRLAYTIFEAEALLGPDDQLPWASFGVPLALIAFDAGTAWQANTAFTVGEFVMDANGNRQQVTTAGTSGPAPAAWNEVYGGTTPDGSVTWTNNGVGWQPLFVDCSAVVRAGGLPRQRSALPAQVPTSTIWQPNIPYEVGDFIIDPYGNVQDVETAGTSGGPPPAWSSAVGSTTTDGSVVWSSNGPSSWRANTTFNVGQFVFDGNGYRQYVTVAGTTGATEPQWNGTYLPTTDGSVTWVNNATGTGPVVQPALAQARINQLSEQLSQAMAVQTTFTTLADLFSTLPPSGILPVAALDFTHQRAPWLPPNWSVTAAPVRLEELETVLETGMLTAPLAASSTAPSDVTELEPVEVLVPLPDALYDPNILVVESVDPLFTTEMNRASSARNLTLQKMLTVQEEVNVLLTAVGPNVPATAGLIDPDAGLTAQEIAGRDLYPPYTPTLSETFATVLQSTWAAGTTYAAGSLVIDANGAVQVLSAGGGTASGSAAPAWNASVGGLTTDAGLTWMNNGSWTWQPGTTYVVGQFVIDPTGFRQVVTVPGISAADAPTWNGAAGAISLDGVVWQAGGQARWQPDTLYAVGNLILDSTNTVHRVQTGGISGDAPPTWNQNLGQTTQDSGVTWTNLGGAAWQPGTTYSSGQAILDANGVIQTVQIGGTSGTGQPGWNDSAGSSTVDAAVSWSNAGPMTWQPNTAYAVGALVFDANCEIQAVQTAGTSGATPPVWNTAPGGITTDNGINWNYISFVSTDLSSLQSVVTQAPYVISYADSAGNKQSVGLLSAADLALLNGTGLQALVTSLNARVAAANDLLDTGFLTSQTDIYRYRQNVLGATAATALATSPVLANIATGSSATATAADLQSYIAGLPTTAPTTAPTPAAAPANAATPSPDSTTTPSVGTLRSGELATRFANARYVPVQASVRPGFTVPPVAAARTRDQLVTENAAVLRDTAVAATPRENFLIPAARLAITVPGLAISPAAIAASRATSNAIPAEITGQSPLAGAQLNIRTLTVAERLAPPPSQEAMFYSISNRLSFLITLTTLCTDLGLAVDDLPILVDQIPDPAGPGYPVRVQTYRFSEYGVASTKQTIQDAIQAPFIPPDASEATLFSVGVRVLEQHTMLLRAVEGRVQQYADFIALCNTALANMSSNIQQAQVYLTQLGNDLQQSRQNVAFTTALLNDETSRVSQVNAQRQQILQSSVQLVAYTRARTLEATDTAPSRQLVPSNITNPVPACLQQSVSIPPELREIVGQLREAPVAWLPAMAAQTSQLDRPILLMQLAQSTQARAALQLQTTELPSSAAGEARVYAARIAAVYTANQQVFRGYQVQRAALQPAVLVSQSWSASLAYTQSAVALNDLMASDAVHAELSNAVARLIQQICTVATCLYTRAGIALPVDRLAWAEYLSGAGASVALQSLAILPNWNSLEYVGRQQMQLLVDWLFLQIDTNNSAASAFMSDVVRTAILLASDVPIDGVLSAGILQRTQPAVGGSVSLTLPSSRVASGMYVNLYSGATLAARGVVTDLDSNTARATITDVYQHNVYLETSDTAHITAQTPQAVALRSLFTAAR